MSISKTRNIITWILTILLAIAFFGSGIMKVTGQAEIITQFGGFGLPKWFAITIGVLEIIGAILLVIPAFTGMAGFGLSIIMIGAVGCHLLYDPIVKIIPALIFFAILTYIYLTRKNVVPKMMQKCLIE